MKRPPPGAGLAGVIDTDPYEEYDNTWQLAFLLVLVTAVLIHLIGPLRALITGAILAWIAGRVSTYRIADNEK